MVTPGRSITRQHIQSYILPTLVLVLFVVGYYPSLALITQKWLASDDYTHAFFIVPAIGYMIWLKRGCLAEHNGGSPVALFFVVAAVLFYLFSLRIEVPTFIFLATAVSLVAVLCYLGGFGVLKELAVPILLFFMIIPIPGQILSMLTASLQLRISEISEILIRLFGVPMFREGNVLHVEKISFQVIEACSGIRSLLSMTTLSILIGYFTLTRISSTVLLLLFSIPVAIAINIVRVVVLVLAFYFLQVDLSVGVSHTLTGLILFLLGLVLLFAFQRLLESWERKKRNS
ncbi:MAG: hypothetical protein A2X81_13860 [Desulfobacterales bacterium GWB2_56_26]|nr:MAG: hypothetical protein A2X81_13860 [Desulfobacterales bacterium GWB2_56_26]